MIEHLPKLVDVASLVPYGANARTHSEEQIEQIKASFRAFGFVGALAYDDQGLAAGHGRQVALLEMWEAGEIVMGPGKREPLPEGMAPGVDITGLSPEERRAFIIADNKLALNAGWNEDLLRQEMAALDALDFDMPVIGFDSKELERLFNPPAEGGKSNPGSMAAEFLIPPFTVLNAREGWWQDRKRQWIALGIQSEVGRGENLLKMSDTMLEPDPVKRAAMIAEREAILSHRGGEGAPVPTPTGQDLLKGEGKFKPGEIHPGGAGGPNSSYNRGRKIDTRATGTQDWVAGKIAEGDIEGGMAAGQTGTSIFDPVLCELAYLWFSPVGGVVLDPFAGGSVRGIVCAALGRRYVGIDLRQEQIEANRSQWPAVADRLGPSAAPAGQIEEVPQLRVEECDGIRVVRDDGVIGGTKRRALDRLLSSIDADEFVYATPAYGFAQIALAHAARAAGKRATIIVAARKERHPRTQLAASAGAQIIEVDAGRLNVIQARARSYCAESGAYLVPFGMDDEMFVEAIADVARSLPGEAPAEVWCVAGSGTLTRALQRAWPDAKHHAVQIGRDPDVGNAKLWKAPEQFEDDATDPPPFPSCSNYDAKAWRFIRDHAAPGALFWNLGADPEPVPDLAVAAEPEWHVGDSLKVIPELDVDADMIFSWPPYGDLEVYSDDPDDISTLDQAEFDAAYAKIIAAAVAKLKDDRFACFVVGDYRDKRGIYANFVSKTIAAFEVAGMGLYNEMILVTSVGSLPIRAAKQFRTSRKAGKALRNGTMILTPTGWTAIERLSVGDLVIAGDGTPTKVTGVYPQGSRPLLTLTFNDGVQIDADPDHLWEISRTGKKETLSTAQIVARWGATPADPRPSIPSCGAVHLDARPVPLHPYLVGLLLGDGGLTGSTPIISSADTEIIDVVRSILPDHVTLKARGYDVRLVGTGARSLRNPLTVELRRIGMMGKLAHEKAVPAIYLWNSPTIRLAVLRGLMDTDGGISGKSGTTEFCSTSRQLADDVVFLARSLGARVKMGVKSTTHREAYIARIAGGPCPFQLKRKADRWQQFADGRIKKMDRRIASILPAEPGAATCIAVDHPSRLFVAENFVVTHNTHQNVLVFVKGDPKRATQALGPVDVSAALADIESDDE